MSNGQFTEAELAARAKGSGLSWLALELDDYGNDARWPAFRDACDREDIVPGAWVTEGADISEAPHDVGFVIAECEGPADYDGIVREQAGMPSVPHAIATNFNAPLYVAGEPNRAAAAKLIDSGWVCLTECYVGANPNATPERMAFTAQQLGWHRTQPVFGVYGEATLKTYERWFDWPGWSVYLAENLW